MSTIAERAVAIGTALADYPDLPLSNLSVWHDGTAYLRADSYGSGLPGVRRLAAWAKEFDTDIIITLSSYGGSGDVETTVPLAGQHVSVKVSIGTAQAYELGRILQRELNRDVSIHIGADELLAAIDQVVA